MKNVERIDFLESKIKNIEKFKDENGFACFEAYPTKVGVYKYATEDGSFRSEFRSEEEVFRVDSIESLALKPFTVEHEGGFVTPEKSSYQVKGSTGEKVEVEGEHLKCKIAVYDKEALDAISKDGAVELSTGYICDTEKKEGVYKGEKYDYIQKNIRYNHVTATVKGRGGETCRIRLDSAGNLIKKKEQMKKKYDGYDSEELKIDAIEYEETEDTAKMRKALDACMNYIKKIGKDKKSDSEIEARVDSLKLQLDALKNEKKTLEEKTQGLVDSKKLDSLLAERDEIKEVAKKIGYEIKSSEDFKSTNKKSITEILVQAGYKKEKLDSNKTYLEFAWDSFYKDHDNFAKNYNSLKNLSESENSQEYFQSDLL